VRIPAAESRKLVSSQSATPARGAPYSRKLLRTIVRKHVTPGSTAHRNALDIGSTHNCCILIGASEPCVVVCFGVQALIVRTYCGSTCHDVPAFFLHNLSAPTVPKSIMFVALPSRQPSYINRYLAASCSFILAFHFSRSWN